MRLPLPPQEDARFVMAPMIDMVFLLLIFFMCASRLSQLQSLELEIPNASRATVPRERPDRLTVNVDREGHLFAGNQAVDGATLRDLVRERAAAQPDLRVYVRADRATPHRHVRRVMALAGEAGVDAFIFGAFVPNE